MPSLDQLRPSQRGRITALQGGDALTQRLMEMGLFEGEEIEVVRLAPLGDPLEIRLGDYFLSLRRSEAARVQIDVLP
ncbi:MAG TPA: ferrous iron transport protein A [Gemmataceae bacterium]|jgi:Fe2+ transport system protein FeoA